VERNYHEPHVAELPDGKLLGMIRIEEGDGGASWNYDYILRDDGPGTDLGYPSTVELGDGSLLTMYYQKPERTEDKCALLWSRLAFALSPMSTTETRILLNPRTSDDEYGPAQRQILNLERLAAVRSEVASWPGTSRHPCCPWVDWRSRAAWPRLLQTRGLSLRHRQLQADRSDLRDGHHSQA
jgi:hypothetical protein